ncbi:PP2C family protein-serine/threonine phosphatase [Streptomyces sp. NPDC052013]|uniref:PP2C family protein-serine/threonine phosphatase n=1 Tax=Streptomyces sp. NPDC052013 TaxID=3365679 RepID=UPI0037D4E46C
MGRYESLPGPAPAGSTEPGGDRSPDVDTPPGLSALRAAVRIGTTLDEDLTWAELIREVAGLVGGAAAVLSLGREGGPRYEAVVGNPAALPAPGRIEAAVRDAAGRGDDGSVHPVFENRRRVLCVPLAAANGHSYGVLVSGRENAPFSPSEIEAVTLLTEIAASHLRHAREYDAVSGMVGRLQRALLSEPARPHPNLDVAIRYLPVGQNTLIGGDWCETVRLHFGRTLLVVGDVMGHGLEAAVDMNAYRSSLRYTASADLPPHRILRQLDDLASSEPDRRPATCLIAQIDPNRGQVTLASAGHLPPAVVESQGRTSLLHVPVGPPLGTGLGGYEPATYRLDPSQTLLLFTDGLVERRDEDIDQSLHRLAQVDFGAATGVEDILDRALTRLDARNAEDDVAVLAARLHQRTSQAHTPAGPAAGGRG